MVSMPAMTIRVHQNGTLIGELDMCAKTHLSVNIAIASILPNQQHP
jgi:hypothetical protein